MLILMKAYVWQESRQDDDSSPCSAKHLAKNRTKPINNLENNLTNTQSKLIEVNFKLLYLK